MRNRNRINRARQEIETNEHHRIVLVGQPNCGKSTIYNQVAGYRSITSNFPGATIKYSQSHVSINHQTFDLIDLPGIYSLTCVDEASAEAQRFIFSHNFDIVINIVDASILSRSLELTLQLLELDKPIILALNMMDEAARKGIQINVDKLSDILHIPVIPTVGSKGVGIKELFSSAFSQIAEPKPNKVIFMSKHVEDTISELEKQIQRQSLKFASYSTRLLAIKLLEGDPYFSDTSTGLDEKLNRSVERQKSKLENAHGQSADIVISSERHAQSMQIFEECSIVERTTSTWRDTIDTILMHNVWGYVFMFSFLFVFFNLIFRLGGIIETPAIEIFNSAIRNLSHTFGKNSLWFNIFGSILQGLAGGIAIVLPYLIPFLLGLAVIEDVGYLPRAAFLMDGFMHRIGLHGMSVIPAVLGYGCNVPAVMATQILHSPRDRFITSIVAVLVPCAARMTVILGLVGFYLGGGAAFSIYLLNILVIAISGSILSRLLPEDSSGMAIEIPPYHLPSIKVVVRKTWLRMRDFITIAWPLLIIGSIILSLAEQYNLDVLINRITSPFTFLLGLPSEVGTTLIFGVLRKELSMLMLIQAMGTTDIQAVMTNGQILVFTIFIVFYIPCLATIGVLVKQIGWSRTIFASLFTLLLAIILSLLARGLAVIIL